MKTASSEGFKTIAVVLLILATAYLITWFVPEHRWHLIVIGISVLFFFHLAVRKIYFFKPYFISKYNVLSRKVRYQYTIDLPKDILFEKFREVIKDSGFRIIYTNKAVGNIFATSGISWVSWGENIYIDLDEREGKTIVDFCSSSLIGIYDWGKNEKNFGKIIQEFESSLTI
jgi:hypothetical protein